MRIEIEARRKRLLKQSLQKLHLLQKHLFAVEDADFTKNDMPIPNSASSSSYVPLLASSATEQNSPGTLFWDDIAPRANSLNSCGEEQVPFVVGQGSVRKASQVLGVQAFKVTERQDYHQAI
jgi:hypothetical protein